MLTNTLFLIQLTSIIVAMYPYIWGYRGDTQKACGCALGVVTKYQKRIFGPLLGRIDIQIEMPREDYEKLNGDRMGETSESIRARVQAAHNIQLKRFANIEGKYPFATSRYIKEIRYQTVNRTCKAITWR